jgi:hypothetical protein
MSEDGLDPGNLRSLPHGFINSSATMKATEDRDSQYKKG